ncbi:MAG: hypothetical protein ABSF73_07770 [Terriglobia bacterium]
MLIADFRLPIDHAEAGLIDRGGSWHTTSSIDPPRRVNQQSAMKARHFGLDKLPLAGRGRYGERHRFFSNLPESTLFAGNPEWYDACLVGGSSSVVSRS